MSFPSLPEVIQTAETMQAILRQYGDHTAVGVVKLKNITKGTYELVLLKLHTTDPVNLCRLENGKVKETMFPVGKVSKACSSFKEFIEAFQSDSVTLEACMSNSSSPSPFV